MITSTRRRAEGGRGRTPPAERRRIEQVSENPEKDAPVPDRTRRSSPGNVIASSSATRRTPFAPRATKILNEGWASYRHHDLRSCSLRSSITPTITRHHGDLWARLNPYKLGIELLRDIEHRWNTGKFGKEYDDCDDLATRRSWDKQLGLGRKKIFEVRRIHNDITFIDTFLTEDFCREHKMFAYAFHDQAGQYVIESRGFAKIKQRLLFSLTNFGKPWILRSGRQLPHRGELLLQHQHNGIDLRQDRASKRWPISSSSEPAGTRKPLSKANQPFADTFDGSNQAPEPLGDTDDVWNETPPGKTRWSGAAVAGRQLLGG